MIRPCVANRFGLWLGPIPSQAALAELPALSPAAVHWERGLFGGMRANGFDLRIISHRPEPLWPRGRFFPGAGAAPADVSFPTHLVRHANAPGLRSLALAAAYTRTANRLAATTQPDFVASFNPLPWHLAAAIEVQSRYGVPWVSFLLDDVLDDPTFERYARETRRAAAHVILSAGAVERVTSLLPGAEILHLDGAIDRWCGDDPVQSSDRSRTVVYSGAHSEAAGMSLLVAAIPYVRADNVTFTITGDRGTHAGLAELVSRDSRVRVVGYLDPQELDALCSKAAAFVNPRPPEHMLSAASFPSKLMQYLAYGKPVASTWTAGLTSAYRPLLVLADGDSPEALAAAIDRALAMSDPDRLALREKVRAFMIPGRLWATQAARLSELLDHVAAAGRKAG